MSGLGGVPKRRAGVFLIDEGHQNDMPGGAPPQVMAHVPLDRSALDHDFFIQTNLGQTKPIFAKPTGWLYS